MRDFAPKHLLAAETRIVIQSCWMIQRWGTNSITEVGELLPKREISKMQIVAALQNSALLLWFVRRAGV
jgi:hypothetical protein